MSHTEAPTSRRMEWNNVPLILIALGCILALINGCEAQYPTLRREGQMAMLDGQYGPARYLLLNADGKSHRKVETLHDLGVCSVMVAKQKFRERNQAAAFRELDNAVAYYRRAIDDVPGHQASLEGLNIALELKGQFEEALKHAYWTAEFVGPSARQFVFLGNELEQRGDFDGAMLRFRQAVTVEPRNAQARIAMAKFLIRHNQSEAAEDELVEASVLDPSNTWVREQLVERGLAGTTPQRIAGRDGVRP